VNSAEIQKSILKWEGRLAQVRESQQKFQSLVSALETERRGLIVDARTKNNEAAKKRITAIAGELDAANRELRDDADAVTECTNRLSTFRADLAVALREEHRARTMAVVQARIDAKLEGKFFGLVKQLRDCAEEIIAADKGVVAALDEFSPELGQSARANDHRAREAMHDVVAHTIGAVLDFWPGPRPQADIVWWAWDRRKQSIENLLHGVEREGATAVAKQTSSAPPAAATPEVRTTTQLY
jgi:hypothetical protein